MTGRLASALTWLLVGLVGAAASAEERPVYVKRLTLPVLDDAMGFPAAVTPDLTTGEVFVCDSRRDRILVFDAEGGFRFEIAGGFDFRAPADLAIHPRGYLYVAASHGQRRGILLLDFDGRFIREIPLVGLPEEAGGPSIDSLAISPTGDRLYAMDTRNLRVWIIDLEGRIQGNVDFAEGLTVVQRENVILGNVDVYGDRVIVALPSLGRVNVYDLDGNQLGSYGRKGTSGCKLAFPMAAAMDTEGVLDIVDRQRMKIVRWSTTDGCIGDYYGLGMRPGFFYFPGDLALDTAGRIYVTQGYDGRVQVYDGVPPAPKLPPLAADLPGDDPRFAIEETVRAWASARAERRAEDYLSAYSEDYFPWGVTSRGEWERLRRAQFEDDKWIVVEVTELEVEMIRDDTARSTFIEETQAERYQTRSRKTLILTWEPGGWKIIEERAAKSP